MKPGCGELGSRNRTPSNGRPIWLRMWPSWSGRGISYEPFLEPFDPVLRKQLGVWYTPTEVVRYMVARVDKALKDDLDIGAGLAAENVYVLDPCCGTGAYLAEVLRRISLNLGEQGLGARAGAEVSQKGGNRAGVRVRDYARAVRGGAFAGRPDHAESGRAAGGGRIRARRGVSHQRADRLGSNSTARAAGGVQPWNPGHRSLETMKRHGPAPQPRHRPEGRGAGGTTSFCLYTWMMLNERDPVTITDNRPVQGACDVEERSSMDNHLATPEQTEGFGFKDPTRLHELDAGMALCLPRHDPARFLDVLDGHCDFCR